MQSVTDKKTERHIWVGRQNFTFFLISRVWLELWVSYLLILMTQIHCVPSKHLTSIIISWIIMHENLTWTNFHVWTSMKLGHEMNGYIRQECIPVGCVPAARRPYAGVCFPGGGVCSRGGCLLPGVGGMGLLRGGVPARGWVSAPGGFCS